jgi:hypothetical protein
MVVTVMMTLMIAAVTLMIANEGNADWHSKT